MKLDQWLEKKGKTQKDFAESFDPPVSQGLVSQWVNGETRITLPKALEIVRLTKGEVTAQDCASMFVEKAAI
jgi:DNA-binding transcriptional regulator YdaS (Cro superfamily)